MFDGKVPKLGLFDKYIIKRFHHLPVVRFSFKTPETTFSFITQYKKYIRKIDSSQTSGLYNLPTYIETKTSGMDTQSIKESTGATRLHQLGYTGKGVKIGIIDTGVSDHTVEFGTRIKGREVFVNPDNGYSHTILEKTDSWGHGTHVAGLAAGSTTGLAPESEIYSAKIIHTTGVTGAGNGGGEETTLGMLAAIDYLINNSVDIINISLGQYHNLVGGLREEIINYVTFRHNILFCVSAGNSGSAFEDRGSLNNPTPALQCISVAASDSLGNSLATFSSKGPKVDYSLKPDLTAPGIGINGPSNLGAGYVEKSGTSMAAPIVTGAAALLINYLQENNLSYTPGTIKAALLSSARDMNFPVWRQGAGFINVSAALNLINSSSKVNNSPDLVHLHPRSLPIDPYKVLFPGSTVEFNLTVITSIAKEIMIKVPESIFQNIKLRTSSYFLNNSMLIPITFTIPRTHPPEVINSSIMLENKNLTIQFEIRDPVGHILFEEGFNRIVKHGFTTNVAEILGDTSNTIGMYSSFTQYLAYKKNFSITPHISGNLTLDYLRNYNAVILSNPYSLSSDIYMDWVENPGSTFLTIPKASTQALYDYVDEGGSLLVISTDGDYCNITDMNEFLSYFGLEVQGTGTQGIVQSMISDSHDWTGNIPFFPFRGNYLSSSGPQTSIIAYDKGNPTIASYSGETGGKVILFGSDLIFDNVGFSSHAYNGNSTHNKYLAYNAIAWLTNEQYEVLPRKAKQSSDEFLIFFILIVLLIVIVISLRIFTT
jgi:hypothetical protein